MNKPKKVLVLGSAAISPLVTGHADVSYLNENFFSSNTFKPHFYNDFLMFVIPKNSFGMNNKQKSDKKGRCEMIRRRKKIRSKEEFISQIKKLVKRDKKYLNYSYLRKIKKHDLLFEACKYFGGWRGAVEAAGYQPLLRTWREKEIIDEIKKIASEISHVPRSKEVIKKGYVGLSSAAYRKFGNWTSALIKAGLKPYRETYTKREALKQIKEIYKKIGYSPSMVELKSIKKGVLLRAGLKHFGKYNGFLRAANLPIVLAMNKWPKKRIISELKKIARKLGRTPRRTELAAMKRYDLINAAETYFSCWSESLIAAGLVPNADILDDNKTWRDWENLIFEIHKRKNISFHKKKYIKKVGYPDIYIPSQKKIVEIKINCSDNSVKKDIEKYLSFCKTLEIWYLYGKPFGILSNKVSFVGPNKIKETIKEDSELLKKFQNIKKEVKGREK